MVSLRVRKATKDAANYIAELSARVQEKLTRSGSLQQIGPIPVEQVAEEIEKEAAFLLELEGRPVGSVFVEQVVTPTLVALFKEWGLVDIGRNYYFLHKFLLVPEQQGQGLGPYFIAQIQQIFAADRPATIVLDCWAGNTKLREFYSQAGFKLHGIFDEDDFQVAVFIWPGS
jgi:GNAT superfamily N-acetyltransferase